MGNNVIHEIASRLDALATSRNRATYSQADEDTATYWAARHRAELERIADEQLPHGGGIDNGTQIDLESSTPERIVLHTAFHHMNDGGFYDGWTEHTIVIKPSLIHGFVLRITGRDRREIKDYLEEVFDCALREEYREPARECKTA